MNRATDYEELFRKLKGLSRQDKALSDVLESLESTELLDRPKAHDSRLLVPFADAPFITEREWN